MADTIETSNQDNSIIQFVKFHAGEIISPFRETQTNNLFYHYTNQKYKEIKLKALVIKTNNPHSQISS